MPSIKVSLRIGLANASQDDVIDIDESEWEECKTEEQKEELIHKYWLQWAWNYIDGGASLIE